MRDDFLSADWGNRHQDMSNGIERLIKMVGDAFAQLAAHQYDAPWEKKNCDAKGG